MQNARSTNIQKSIVWIFLCIFLLGPALVKAQNSAELRVEPPFWWAGMNNNKVQLLVHGKNIAGLRAEINYPGVSVQEQILVENPNYIFLNLLLDKSVQPGAFNLELTAKGKTVYSYRYEIKQRSEGSAGRKGFTASDVVYLLMPDRFANGNPDNDNMPGMIEKADRSNPLGRHGGDVSGIRKHLDYLKDLGVTALWINPLLENNNKALTYHGYAITDFYKIDARYGTNDDYVALVNEAHQKNMKIIMDMVFNHCGINHWFINDLPMKNWIHQFPEYTRSNFRAESLTDPHASEADKTLMLQGWFDTNMPDLDQRNALLKEYLIQNSIWWIEFAGLDGIRLDTQPYPYKEMMTEWSERVFDEYPDFSLVGEAWLQKESMTAYYQKDAIVGDGYNSGVPSVTDFPLSNAMSQAFTENEGWSEGMARLYYVLSQDFLYHDPYSNLIFLDNHDLNRYFNSIGKDLPALKMALTFLLTTRGIPQIYYGTELLMDGNIGVNHGEVRKDFPGGWPADTINAFTRAGRTDLQNEAFDYMQKLLQWRKNNKAVTQGTLKHFVPENGVYVYFRTAGEQTVMVVINRNTQEQTLATRRFAECMSGYSAGFDVLNGRTVSLSTEIKLQPRSAIVLELRK
ncbi:MAG: glycoside hydrolase family 13 protein [Lentimicrobiaceae bacterium]|nr:glycoside hydrolase family 13 protein [Lentimicrobiaceae bacterium]MCB9023005.1 glycoside hydrolase family 13 protein [Lentimicrobiaceae bacterium]HPG32262.1 glycoside hydrolase family 13 protein [Lentimicrobium sp.]